ncbi:MAG TPA: ATP-binding protein [Anaeromyxobacteraceae bacterium]|nr:ATP-binding protein [Anaeromyxobacteraceae bacterium]
MKDPVHASEERLRLALDATSEVVWDWNVRADEIYQGPRWAELLGHSPDETPTCMPQLASYIHPDDLPIVEREVSRAIGGATDTITFEHRVRAASGEWRWMLARARVVERDGAGVGVRIVGTCGDITAQKQAEEALRELDRRREQFLAVLSHELRNPLAAARNALFVMDCARAGSLEACSARAIVDRQVGQLTRLVEDLLDASRITRAKIRLQKSRLDLVDLARRSADENRFAFQAKGIELRLELPRNEVWVDCDPTRIVQVLGNLLQNAAKFTHRGHALLSLDIDGARREAVVRVRDTGIGIAPELQNRLFRPFEQGEGTLDRGGAGLGLGLALVRGLVELHGGTVEAQSDGPGTGTELTVRLPMQAVPPAVEPLRPPQEASRRLRIVAVEDDQDAALVLGEVLEILGHTVHIAHTGREALELVRAVRPDAVLCDIGLPGMSGYDVARAIRRDPDVRDIPLVALTGYAAPADVQQATDAGFDHHLAKPTPPAELSRVLVEVSRAPATARGAGREASG